MSLQHGQINTASITDVSITLPSLGQITDVLLLQAGFNAALVIVGATLLGLAAGIVGSFALLRKRSLMGDALAHSALPGLALAFIGATLLGFQGRNLALLLAGATVSGVIGVLAVQMLSKYTRLTEDAAIGAVLSIFFGIGIVLLSIIQSMESGSAGGLSQFIYGQTAAMRLHDAYLMIGITLVAIFAALLLLKEFTLVCFDPDFAVVQGWPCSLIDLGMMALVTVVTVIGLQSVGMILIVALLIIPAAAARYWTEKLSLMVFIAALLGGLSGYLGAAASALLPRLPAGSVIVLTGGFIFALSFFFAPRRGLLAGIWRRLLLRDRILTDHLLRDLYETCEKTATAGTSSIELTSLRIVRGWNPLLRTLFLWRCSLRDLICLSRESISLSDKGLIEAGRLIRNHRLWEQFLVHFADVLPSHVDYSADQVEHILSPEIVATLEERLQAQGLLPSNDQTLSSVHPLQQNGACD